MKTVKLTKKEERITWENKKLVNIVIGDYNIVFYAIPVTRPAPETKFWGVIFHKNTPKYKTPIFSPRHNIIEHKIEELKNIIKREDQKC